MTRTGTVNEERTHADRVLYEHPLAVRRHRVYHRLMGRLQHEARPMELVNDLDQYLAQKEQETWGDYREPGHSALSFYRSFLTVPVTSLLNHSEMIGVLCVDSPNKHVFSEDLDLEMMHELANHISTVYGSYHWVKRWQENRSSPPA
jgi:signal transduction protein with GAF and PtsI domain